MQIKIYIYIYFCSSCVSTFGISNTYFPLPLGYKFYVNWCVDDSFLVDFF
jgi:hypothetical protein